MNEKHKWNAADTVTSIRIIGSVFLLFPAVGSSLFLLVYTLVGLTDILDGWIARKWNITSEFGSKLDSIADLLFYTIMMLRILPILLERMPMGVWCMLAGILLIRLISYAVAAFKYRRFASLHTLLNKLTGAAVFLLPYMLFFSKGVAYGYTICVIAIVASLEELAIHLFGKEYRAHAKMFFRKED